MKQNVFSNTKANKKGPKGNPFARALAETERGAFTGGNKDKSASNPFADALAKTGGNIPETNNQNALETQQKRLEEQAKKDRLKRQRHKEINPIDSTELFNAREKRVKEEIDKVRQELKMLAIDVAKFQRDVDITLMTEVVSPGQDGKYYITFFQKLRAWIRLLRQQIKSAGTWATQLNGKKKKKRKKTGKGLEVSGAGHEKTDMVQKMMHHENSTVYSGG
ncbi:MAG: DUF5660 family protein [Patescibacteria group bacterium]